MTARTVRCVDPNESFRFYWNSKGTPMKIIAQYLRTGKMGVDWVPFWRSKRRFRLITSTVWRQDHNGFTHNDPRFLDVVLNKSAAVTCIQLPPDVNSLLSVATIASGAWHRQDEDYGMRVAAPARII